MGDLIEIIAEHFGVAEANGVTTMAVGPVFDFDIHYISLQIADSDIAADDIDLDLYIEFGDQAFGYFEGVSDLSIARDFRALDFTFQKQDNDFSSKYRILFILELSESQKTLLNRLVALALAANQNKQSQ